MSSHAIKNIDRSRFVTSKQVYEQLGLADAHVMVDVRAEHEITSYPRLIPGAILSDADHLDAWAKTLSRTQPVVTYCSEGSERSCAVADTLVSLGFPAFALQGGIRSWNEAGYATTRHRADLGAPGGSRWVTRERPKIDRLACPWLVRRFIDPEAEFFYAPAHRVRMEAQALRAQPYDIADVTFSHRGPRCSFDAFLDEFDLHDPIVDKMAEIVRGADTGELALSREAPGLLAISLGLSANFSDDLVLLGHAIHIYDALYAWCKKAQSESHSWPTKTTQ